MLRLILMVLAFVILALAAFGVQHPRMNMVALGLSVWVLAELLGGFPLTR